MPMRGFVRESKPLEVLSQGEVERIHRATLAVLEETGVVFDHDKALGILADSGCRVDFDKRLVKIPSYLAEECIRKCPSSFRVRARDPRSDLMIGGSTIYCMTF